MKLSIITPYYKTYEEIKKLAEVLIPQLNDSVEWIIVDDGCNETRLDEFKKYNQNIRIWHRMDNSGGASVPRNIGLNFALGEYIAFIDSDDLVSDDYIYTILKKTDKNWDYCFISWRGSHDIIIRDKPPKWNMCVWNCVYKKDLIGNTRFREDLIIAEDYFFNLEVRKGIKANIKKVIYYYNENSKNSLSKQGITYNEKYQRQK